MRLQDRPPLEAGIVEKAVRCHRLAPAITRLRYACPRVAAFVYINTLARRFRRASPRSSYWNSCSVHVDPFANCATQKTRVSALSIAFARATRCHGGLVYNEVANLGLLNYKMNENFLFILIRAEVARAAKAAVTIAKVVGVVSIMLLMKDIIRM